MRVLLLGDYSSVHYNLWRILNNKGIDCTLLSDGDGYKNIPTNLKWFPAPAESKAKIYANVHGREFWEENYEFIKGIKGFDVVQIINPVICEQLNSNLNKLLFDILTENNKKVFMYAVGDDTAWVSYHIKNKTKSMFNNKKIFLSKEIYHCGRYLFYPGYRNLSEYVASKVNAIIPGSVDYLQPYEKKTNCTKVVPFPIDVKKFELCESDNKRVKIFHGIQNGKNYRKGDYVFNKAKSLISNAEFIDIRSVPFSQYIELMKNSDIIFDQTFSYDQGMNAIMGMAYGKVVFSGFEDEFLKYYNLNNDEIGINATSDFLHIADKTNELITSSKLRKKISESAREFIIKNHSDNIVCDEFIKIWESY